MSQQRRRQTVRLVIHVPTYPDAGLAAWALTSVIDGGHVPVGEVWLSGHIPLGGPRADEARVLEAIDRIVSQYLLH